ncbi:MAG: beta-lactamase family protein [Anaerolineales bacterium]|nr:beta-lactamase family protein [Anaerolineales bacterium]
MVQLRFRFTLATLGIMVLLSGCSRADTIQVPDPFQIPEAEWPTSGWQTSTPESQGMDSSVLKTMLETVQTQNYNIDSITVIRNGYLVLDASLFPYRQDSKHIIHSCTKSIVSILIGIAIDQDFIEGIQTPVLEFFPDRTVSNLDPDKKSLTLENLLTMTSGLECRDSYLYRWSGLNEMRGSDDWVQFMLDLPMEAAPGTKFEYCNGASFLLSAIITETTGMSSNEFAEINLFTPLGISDLSWPINPQGINIGWGELRMLPQDMAKIGYLYLNGGEWDGEQIVPTTWVEDSTRKYISATLEDGYGYQWWVDNSGVYLALGYAGQFIFVVPEKELVVVFTSDLSDSDFYTPQNLLNDYIIPAAVSPDPLPENPAAEAALHQLIEDLSLP